MNKFNSKVTMNILNSKVTMLNVFTTSAARSGEHIQQNLTNTYLLTSDVLSPTLRQYLQNIDFLDWSQTSQLNVFNHWGLNLYVFPLAETESWVESASSEGAGSVLVVAESISSILGFFFTSFHLYLMKKNFRIQGNIFSFFCFA